jgi:hypothetical protein
MTLADLLVTDMSPSDQRKHLSELVRVAELNWNAADDNASRLEEGRSIIMADMKLELVASGTAKSLNQADDYVRSSQKWKDYVRKMHDARRVANDLRTEWRKLERDYFGANSDEKREQNQMRMSR